MLIFVLVFLALSAHCLRDSYNPSHLQKQIDGVVALFARSPPASTSGLCANSKRGTPRSDPAAPKGESCRYVAIEALRSVCQPKMSAGGAERDAATFVGASAAEATAHVD